MSRFSPNTRRLALWGWRGHIPWVAASVACLLLLALGHTTAQASDPIGVYALVDKVVLEPNDTSPEHIQIWGVFALAKGRGDTYEHAQRGYLYYRLRPDETDICRKEWADLKSVASTDQCIGFASRFAPLGKVRKASEKPVNPDVYPTGWGITKVRSTNYPPVRELYQLHASDSAKQKGTTKPPQ